MWISLPARELELRAFRGYVRRCAECELRQPLSAYPSPSSACCSVCRPAVVPPCDVEPAGLEWLEGSVRQCSLCRRTQPLEDFNRDPSKRYEHDQECKRCNRRPHPAGWPLPRHLRSV